MENNSILIVDDDVSIRILLKHLLAAKEWKVSEASNGEEALRMIEKDMPDLVILDIDMPGFNGFEVSRIIRENQKYNLIYIIFLTGKTDAEDKVLGYNIGADDYITKPFDTKELQARVAKGFRHLSERRNANMDPLTQLYNRYFFNIYLSQVLESAKRYEQPLSMIIADIDHFKKVNDTHGHAAGDIILKEMASILNKFCRKTDIACRWGGEEFLLLLPNTALEGAGKIAERIRHEVENHPFSVVEKLTASFGVSQFKDSEEEWFQNADIALYKAKEDGRNKVVEI